METYDSWSTYNYSYSHFNNSNDSVYSYGDNEYYPYSYYNTDIYMYEGFLFESSIYLYVWEIFAVFAALANLIIITIIINRNSWNSTNTVLLAIAIAEIGTVLSAMPAYMYVYPKLEDGLVLLSKKWCNFFFFSKYFMSKTFRTAAIWLHCVLGLQRFISIHRPFKARVYFSITKTLIGVIGLYCVAPFVHIYQAINYDKTVGLECKWLIAEDGEVEFNAYLWLRFLLVHFLPCIVLSLCTVILLVKLFENTSKIRNTNSFSIRKISVKRSEDNWTITKTALSVLIVFLIPEMMFSIVFVYKVIAINSGEVQRMTFKVDRAVSAAYEILVALSYCANFWIYMVLNQTFKDEFFKLLKCKSVRSMKGMYACGNSFTSSSSSKRTRQTQVLPKRQNTEISRVTDIPKLVKYNAEQTALDIVMASNATK